MVHFDELTLANAGWGCPSPKACGDPTQLTPEFFADMADRDKVLEWMDDPCCSSTRLPIYENIESAAYSMELTKGQWHAGEYTVESLSDFDGFDYSLLTKPMTAATLGALEELGCERVMLDIIAPFSVLSGVTNPTLLYCLSGPEDMEKLQDILRCIADAECEYVAKAIEYGCRIFSLSDPVGTMNLTGEDFYRSFCLPSQRYLLQKLEPLMKEKNCVTHICRQMSQSMMIAKSISAEEINTESPDNEDIIDVLLSLADNPNIAFTGMTCIHNPKPNLKRSFAVHVL